MNNEDIIKKWKTMFKVYNDKTNNIIALFDYESDANEFAEELNNSCMNTDNNHYTVRLE